MPLKVAREEAVCFSLSLPTSAFYKYARLLEHRGGNLSPLLSNIMLNELDNELEARGLNFVRYADDCKIFVGSRKAAERVMKFITDFIERKLEQ